MISSIQFDVKILIGSTKSLIKEESFSNWFFLITSSFALRLMMSLRGSNYDFHSYRIVVSAISAGHFPWDTGRYNYGPIWAYILWLINVLSGNNSTIFRILIIGILTTTDFFIYLLLKRRFSIKTGIIFLFNPVSIIISGYHNQFDNVAILIGLWALLRMESKSENLLKVPLALGGVLGLSISIKHDFLLFLIWIFFTKKIINRLQIIAVSIAIPVFLIFPFFLMDKDNIIKYYFKYTSYNNAPLMKDLFLTSGWSPGKFGLVFFVLGLTLFGYLTRMSPIGMKISIYTLVFVAFSSSIANQYLVIPAIGAAVYANMASFAFFIYCTATFIVNSDELHFFSASPVAFHIQNIHARLFPLFILLILIGSRKFNFFEYLKSQQDRWRNIESKEDM
jgi:hypothetical protein